MRATTLLPCGVLLLLLAIPHKVHAQSEFVNEVVDGAANNVGQHSSLAVDPQGKPHLSYYDTATGNLKYARKSGAVWTIETADGSANFVGTYTSITLDAQGNPHVSYVDETSDDLKYARKSGGAWTTETADGSANFVGYDSSIALDAQGNPHVSHYDGTTGDLKYARKSGGVWTNETADGSANLVGLYTSNALDAQGNLHVSYLDGTTGDLKYALKSAGVWTVETADGSANAVGYFSSIALDAQGNPHASYYDNTVGDLKLADAAVHLLNPAPGVSWPVGSRQEIAWSGVGTVDLYLSSDGGSYEEILADNVIASPIVIRVPHIPSRFARLTLLRSSPFSTSTTDSFFTINATIALLKFQASTIEEASKRSVRLSWETAPGPEADVRYRIERMHRESTGGSSAEFEPAHSGLLDVGEYLDAEAGAFSHYRLVAVNGLGEEYVLGETASAPALGDGRSIVASPNVARDGEIQVAFRVASDLLGTDVAVFDASGRLVRGLASGVFPAGIRSVTWDGRNDRGERASAGVYFVRLAWGGQPRESARITILR
jgi:hypothetical protein